jgi:hypothetical protein
MTLRNDSTIRQYRPKVGQLISMGQWTDYTSRGLSPWGRLRVIGIDKDTVTVRYAPHPMDASCDDQSQITIPLYTVQPSIGWEPRYTIHCKPEQVETVKSWFARGIVCRQSHNMSSSMPMAFQPLTDGVLPGSPHWQFPEDTDVIMPEDCARLFRIVSVEQEEITSAVLGYPADPNCHRCKGTGRRTVAELAIVRKSTLAQTWDDINTGKIPLDDLTSTDFRCHCAQYGAMTRMGRTKRAKLIKQMRADGWQVEYRPYAGGYWERRRETIVHDWTEVR